MTNDTNFKHAGTPSESEAVSREQLYELFERCPIPADEKLANIALYLKRQDLSRLLFLHDIYRRIIEVDGIVMELGVRWGPSMALFTSLRGIYEPFNYTRKVVGFDTFEGFPTVDPKDGVAEVAEVGSYGVTEDYDEYLRQVLDLHEQESPVAHIKKHEVVRGNACDTLPAYLEEHPETVVALAYFDFDVYEPTRVCLEALKPHLTRGSVLVFDELNDPGFPGETAAVREVLGLDRYKIQRSPLVSYPAFLVID